MDRQVVGLLHCTAHICAHSAVDTGPRPVSLQLHVNA